MSRLVLKQDTENKRISRSAFFRRCHTKYRNNNRVYIKLIFYRMQCRVSLILTFLSHIAIVHVYESYRNVYTVDSNMFLGFSHIATELCCILYVDMFTEFPHFKRL